MHQPLWLAATFLYFAWNAHAAPYGSVVYDIRANHDTSDLLIIHGSTVQWHHDNTGAAVGRHGGDNLPTSLSGRANDGPAQTNDWVPNWPSLPPNEIRFDAYSSVFTNLQPPAPREFLTVSAMVMDGRGTVTITQSPNAANDFTTILRFADGANGAEWLRVQLAFQYAPEPAPLVELRFNETGTPAPSTGLDTNAAALRNFSGVPTDLHSGDATGVSGLPGDRAFDNSSASGMGSLGTGGKALAPDLDAVDGLVSFTLQGWFRCTTLANNRARFFDKKSGNTSFLLAVTNGYLTLEVNGTATDARTNYTDLNTWVFFAATYDSTALTNQARFFKGTAGSAVELTDADTLSRGTALANSVALNVGNAAAGDRPFKGLLDNMRIYGSKTDGRGALNIAQLEWLRVKDLTNAPGVSQLSVARSGAVVAVKWPVYPRSFFLQSATNATGSPFWLPENAPVSFTGNTNTALLTPGSGMKLFRLLR